MTVVDGLPRRDDGGPTIRSVSQRPTDPYVETMQQVGRRHGVTTKRAEVDAARPPGCPVPIIDDTVPAPVARWAAAHELAHVKLRHDATVPGLAKLARIATYVLLIILLLLAVLGVFTRDTLWVAVLLGALGTLMLWALAHRAIGANLRLADAAADDLTARWGFPVTDEVATALAARERGVLRHVDLFRLARRPADRVTIRNPKPRG